MDEWLIWSFEHNGWWAPMQRGYVASVANAGRYTRGEAERICRGANYGDTINEAMLPYSETFTDTALPARIRG